MMPVIAWNALHASTILTQALDVLRTRCVDGHRGRRGAVPRAARSQHGDRDGAQPVHRLRRRPRRSRRSRSRTGRPIRELVLERGLLRSGAARSRSCRAEVDDAAGHRRRSVTTRAHDASRRRVRPAPAARMRLRLLARCTRPLACSALRRRSDAATAAFPAQRLGDARGARPRRVAEARADHGRARHRRRQRTSPTSAPAAAGSRCGWRAASVRTASSTPRTCSGR